MRDAFTVIFAVTGLVLFLAGSVLWLRRRQQGRAINPRLTGTLITAGVALFLFATVVLRPS